MASQFTVRNRPKVARQNKAYAEHESGKSFYLCCPSKEEQRALIASLGLPNIARSPRPEAKPPKLAPYQVKRAEPTRTALRHNGLLVAAIVGGHMDICINLSNQAANGVIIGLVVLAAIRWWRW